MDGFGHYYLSDRDNAGSYSVDASDRSSYKSSVSLYPMFTTLMGDGNLDRTWNTWKYCDVENGIQQNTVEWDTLRIANEWNYPAGRWDYYTQFLHNEYNASPDIFSTRISWLAYRDVPEEMPEPSILALIGLGFMALRLVNKSKE